MKLSSQLIVAALVGTITVDQVSAIQRHHHHHHSYVQTQGDADTAGDAAGAEGAEAAKQAKEAVAEKMPTAEDVKKEAAEVLKPKAADQSTEAQRTWAEARADDAADAASVAKHDALGKEIFADMYRTRAQDKLDAAAEAEKASQDMVEVLKARMEVNDAAER
jgi:hypothetical protein